jgi:hypothetical protein
MAAYDAFHAIIEDLSAADRQNLVDHIAQMQSQLQAARSEDARMRLLDQFIRQTRELLHGTK